MKNKFPIIIVIFFNYLVAYGQGRNVKINHPCDKEFLKKIPGRWMPVAELDYFPIPKQYKTEILKRLSPVREWAMNVYPSPMAFDAMNWFGCTDPPFAAQMKIGPGQDISRVSPTGGIPTLSYSFAVKFCNYFCGNDNSYFKGAGCETGTLIRVTTNSLVPFFAPLSLDKYFGEIFRIDERPIRMMPVITGIKWKGYDLYAPEKGGGPYMVLLHREGVLPYIPVTRKQYLERTIACMQIFFENTIKAYNDPALAPYMNKKDIEENIKKQEKIRDDVLKFYRDEVEVNTRAGLLDAPAILTGDVASVQPKAPLFTTMEKSGSMLVTENAAYFRKDLPKYIPQLIVYSMVNENDGPDPAVNPYHFYYRDFPIEKLQGMIDR